MTHTIRPAKNQLFCQPDEAERATASGILLTTQAAEAPRTAKIINVGLNVSQFESKQTIVYKSYSTTDIKLDGQDFFLIAEDDVLGTVVETE